MINPVSVPLSIDRGAPRVFTIAVSGINLTSASWHGSVRSKPDAPGDPIIDLPKTASPTATGVRLVSVDTSGPLPISYLRIQIAAMNSGTAAGQLPPAAEIGQNLSLFWDFFVAPAGVTEAKWFYGAVTVLGTATKEAALLPIADDAIVGAADMAVAFTAAALTLTLGGSDLLGPIVAAAAASATAAQLAALNASASALALATATIVAGAGGYLYDAVSHTRYMYGVVAGAAQLVVAPTHYLDFDAAAGGDGTTSATTGAHAAFNSEAAVKAAWGASTTQKTLAIKGSATWRRAQLDFSNGSGVAYTQISVVAYGPIGTTPLVRFDGCDILTKSSFAPNATYPSTCYDISYASLLKSTGSYPRQWQDGKPLKRAASLAACNATAGTWYVAAIAVTSNQTVTIHPYGGTDPRSDASVYEATTRDYAVGLSDQSMIHGIYGRRTGSHNGEFATGASSQVSRCLAEEGTIHNWVFGDGPVTDVIAVNCMDGEYGDGCIMGTNFVSGSAAGLKATLTRCEFLVDPLVYGGSIACGSSNASTYYCHDTASIGWATITFNQPTFGKTKYGAQFNAGALVANDFLPLGFNGTSAPFASIATATLTGGYAAECGRITDSVGSVTASGLITINETNGVSGALFFGAANVALSGNVFILGGAQNANSTVVDLSAAGAGSTLTGSGNIFDGYRQAIKVSSSVTVNTSNEVFRSKDGLGEIFTVAGVQKTLAQWQALGGTYGAGSAEGDPQWAVAKPTIASPDPTLAAGGTGATRQPTPIAKSYVQSLLARPQTLAQAITYLENAAPALNVAL